MFEFSSIGLGVLNSANDFTISVRRVSDANSANQMATVNVRAALPSRHLPPAPAFEGHEETITWAKGELGEKLATFPMLSRGMSEYVLLILADPSEAIGQRDRMVIHIHGSTVPVAILPNGEIGVGVFPQPTPQPTGTPQPTPIPSTTATPMPSNMMDVLFDAKTQSGTGLVPLLLSAEQVANILFPLIRNLIMANPALMFPNASTSLLMQRLQVMQSNHGFMVGQTVFDNGTNWVLGGATAMTGPTAMVAEVIDANNFRLATENEFIPLPGMVRGTNYYAGTAPGSITATPPASYSLWIGVGAMENGVSGIRYKGNQAFGSSSPTPSPTSTPNPTGSPQPTPVPSGTNGTVVITPTSVSAASNTPMTATFNFAAGQGIEWSWQREAAGVITNVPDSAVATPGFTMASASQTVSFNSSQFANMGGDGNYRIVAFNLNTNQYTFSNFVAVSQSAVSPQPTPQPTPNSTPAPTPTPTASTSAYGSVNPGSVSNAAANRTLTISYNLSSLPNGSYLGGLFATAAVSFAERSQAFNSNPPHNNSYIPLQYPSGTATVTLNGDWGTGSFKFGIAVNGGNGMIIADIPFTVTA